MHSIKTKVLAAGAMGLLIVIVLGVAGIIGIRNGLEILETVFEHYVEPTGHVQEMDRNLKEIRFRMAAVLLDQMPTVGSRNHLKEARAAIEGHWQALRTAVATHGIRSDPETAKLLERIEKPMGTLPAFLDKLDGAYAADDKKLLTLLLEEEWPVFHGNLIKPLGEVLPLQQAAVKRIFEENRGLGARLLAIDVGATAIGIILMLAMASVLLRVSRRIDVGVHSIQAILSEVASGNLGVAQKENHLDRNDEFGEMAGQLQTAVGKLAEVTGGVRTLADQVAATATDLLGRMSAVMERGRARNEAMLCVGTAAEEINASSQKVAEFAAVSELAAAHNQEAALAGSNDMDKGLEITREVVGVARESAATVERLNGSIQEIGKIAVVIKEIADQTNLLALNAAIEAARAGEAGRGFAVVADEVRKLAERTALSTSEITRVINTIRQETEATVLAMHAVSQRVEQAATYNQSTGEALTGIVAGAQESTGQVRQIAKRVHEQSTATAEMCRRLAEITALSESNASSIREAVDAAKEMSTVALRLHDLVRYFHG